MKLSILVRGPESILNRILEFNRKKLEDLAGLSYEIFPFKEKCYIY